MSGIKTVTKRTLVLDMVRSIMEIAQASVKLTINLNVSQTITVKACLIVVRVIKWKGGSSRITGPIGLTTFYSL